MAGGNGSLMNVVKFILFEKVSIWSQVQ